VRNHRSSPGPSGPADTRLQVEDDKDGMISSELAAGVAAVAAVDIGGWVERKWRGQMLLIVHRKVLALTASVGEK
jgi:hypothetical protein